MSSLIPLPSDLERFVCDQIASGRFSSEGDVVRAALHLLRESAPGDDRPAGPQSLPPTGGSRPPVTGRWESPAEWRAASPARETSPPPARRSPRGLLADLRSDLAPDDFRAARSELWAGFRPGGAG